MKATAKIAVFDTTLRDGEQAAGTRLGSRDKIRLARQLARLKVDVIEAGFPASSPEDFDAVRKIAQEIKGPTRKLPDWLARAGGTSRRAHQECRGLDFGAGNTQFLTYSSTGAD